LVEEMGKEINYMTEFDKYGRESHYQDPTRGRIAIAVNDARDATALPPIGVGVNG